MNRRTAYHFLKEPAGREYERLLECAFPAAAHGLLVLRDLLRFSPSAQDVLEELRSCGRTETQGSEWPGTSIGDGKQARIIQFRLDRRAVGTLTSAVSGLYGWLAPDRPEDLALLRRDGSAWLTSISRAGDSYLTLSAQEFEDLQGRAPDLVKSLIAVVARISLHGLRPATGFTMHSVGLRELPTPWALRIVRFAGGAGFYLFYDDDSGREMTDTWHETLDAAFEQAALEFNIRPQEWERLGS